MKILKNKYIYIIIIYVVLNCFCTPLSNITKINKKDYLKITKIKKFTVLLEDASGKEDIYLETLKAGLFFNPQQLSLKGMKKLNLLYGSSIALILNEKASLNNQIQYIPPESLILIKPLKGEEDLNRQWLLDSEIDAVFTIQQEKISMDYSTRIPDLGPLNLIYTLLILDLWYVDALGQWYLKNDFSYRVYFPKSGKSFFVKGLSWSELMGEYRFSEITLNLIETTLQVTIQSALEGSLKYVE